MRFTHDPQAVLDYYVDWSAWLGDGETITDATWAVSGNTGAAPTVDPITSTTTPGVWVSEAALGDRLTLTCHIVTSETREDDRSITLAVVQR